MRVFGLSITRENTKEVETRGLHASGDLDPSSALLMQMFNAVGSTTGVSVTPLSALGAATVFACVRVLATTLSSLPLEVFRREGRAGVPAPAHPLNYLFQAAPNAFMTLGDVLGAAQVNLSLSGKGFIEVQRGGGEILGLYPVNTNRVSVQISEGGVYYTLDGAGIPRRNMVHLRGLTFDGLTGINTSYQVREAIALALALQENAAKFFGNGSRPGAVLEHPANLSKDAQERLKKSIDDQTTGKNLYRTLILEEGMKLAANRSENKDSQFIESRDRQDLEICRVFGVPPHKVGVVSAQPKANIEQENLSFVSDNIRPLAAKYGQEFTRVLLTPEEVAQGYYIGFNFETLLRGDLKSRSEAYAIGRNWGWYSVNDIRAFENLPPVPGGDVYLQPLNMVDMNAPKPDPATLTAAKPAAEDDTETETEPASTNAQAN